MKSSEKKRKKVPFQELPDCVISYIFSKLSTKDLVKTSTLSKRWLHEWRWRSTMDLKFDLQNMFDSEAIREIGNFINSTVQNEFARRVDQFMLHYQGSMIHSLRVDFPLGDNHSDLIDRLISQVIAKAKGTERIELLFSSQTPINPYKFSYTLLSKSDSLKYLHIQNCILLPPLDLSGFKKLTTLVAQRVVVEQNLLLGLFSNCIHLVDLTLSRCEFSSDINITSPKLCHLNIDDPNGREAPPRNWKIDIFALNLLSFKYADGGGKSTISNIMAPRLSEFSWACTQMPPIVFSGLKNLTLKGLRIPKDLMPCLFSECLQLEDLTLVACRFESHMNIISRTLRHLNIYEILGGILVGKLRWKINIDALNLSSFEYRSHRMISSIKAPQLSKFFLYANRSEEISHAFDMIASLHHFENLAMNMSHSDSQIARLTRGLGPFQNLRKLEFYIQGPYDSNMDYFLILDIVMVSPHLQKLSLTVQYPDLVARERQRRKHERQRREHVGFSHSQLKYVEFRGFIGTINEIELASLLLRNVSSLKQITFGPSERFYLGVGEWCEGRKDCNCFERNQIREMLKDEVNEQCQLIIL